MLFNLALELVIRNAGIDTSATLTNKSKQIVGYADDLNILGRPVPSIKEAFGNLETAAKDLGLTVNEHKTKFMLQSRKHRVNGQNITIGNYNFQGVNNFAYFGSNVSSDNDDTKEIRKRIDAANLNEAPVGRSCPADARNAGGKIVFLVSVGGKRPVGKPRAR
ncbi:hypothetical protein J437_LFUL010561 [Ladona fulva]|uniref:Reverse transcriptase domain-containing protein n=1 Tax=Ladona fulva TaxID=123851 RepID=A0A8K0P2J0_LADFU|nr:hypothetical protein J437_LFUL010561 [Ladona fulva]